MSKWTGNIAKTIAAASIAFLAACGNDNNQGLTQEAIRTVFTNQFADIDNEKIKQFGPYAKAAEKFIKKFTSGSNIEDWVYSETKRGTINPAPDLTDNNTTNADIARILYANPSDEEIKGLETEIRLIRLAALVHGTAAMHPNFINTKRTRHYYLTSEMAKADGYKLTPNLQQNDAATIATTTTPKL